MYIKIHRKYNNTGSCQALVHRLNKQHILHTTEEHPTFFSQNQQAASADQVVTIIDSNHKKLGKADAKFFLLTISPSADEIAHLLASKAKLRQYTKAVMEVYAQQFQRKLDGKLITGADLCWFAKIVATRSYSPSDPKHYEHYQINRVIAKQLKTLQNQIRKCTQESERLTLTEKITQLESEYIKDLEGTVILPHQQKDGLNMHVQIIVSRKDQSGRLKLSPLANSKGSKNILNGRPINIGFHRKDFVANCEAVFDKLFSYPRDLDKSFKYYHAKKYDATTYFYYCERLAKDTKLAAKKAVKAVLDKNLVLQQVLAWQANSPIRQRKAAMQLIEEASGLLLQLKSTTHTTGMPLHLVYKALRQVASFTNTG